MIQIRKEDLVHNVYTPHRPNLRVFKIEEYENSKTE